MLKNVQYFKVIDSGAELRVLHDLHLAGQGIECFKAVFTRVKVIGVSLRYLRSSEGAVSRTVYLEKHLMDYFSSLSFVIRLNHSH